MSQIQILLVSLLIPILAHAQAEKHPLSQDQRNSLRSNIDQAIESYDAKLKKKPESVDLLSRRGDMYLFAGKFSKSVADFEKMIELDPTTDAPHWRLGIAYYYIDNFKKGMHQFSKYHAYDALDRENGVWKFFCQANLEGIEKAQQNMLPYTRFDRHPFPDVYDLLAGKNGITAESILKAAEESKESQSAKVRRLFFAHLYIGMWHEIHGRKKEALHHLNLATANQYGLSTRTYMWQVARIHYEQLSAGNYRIPLKK